jgi:heme/copper-type cytochrome/quinol oxidase subunit 3
MAASPATLALPPAGGTGAGVEARRGILPLATTLASTGVLMVMGGLVGAYLSLKAATPVWPPKGTAFDRYTATTLCITVLMAMVAIEWAAYGIRKAFRGQALFGFALTAGLAVAHLNGLAYLVSRFPFAAGASPYATVVYALCGVAFLAGAVALGAVVLTALRAAGHQLSTDNYALMRSTAILWHAAAIAWIVAYYTVYITK